MTIDNLTIEDINIIIEALLFSSSADTIAEWDEKDALNMIDIAVKIKRSIGLTNDNVISDKIKIAKENNCDNLAKIKLIKDFFNLNEY